MEEQAELRGAEGEEAVQKAINEINRREIQQREAERIREATKGRRHDVLPEVQVLEGMTTVEEMWDSIKGERVAATKWETVTG